MSSGDGKGKTMREEVEEKKRRKEDMEDVDIKKEKGHLALSPPENLLRTHGLQEEIHAP